MTETEIELLRDTLKVAKYYLMNSSSDNDIAIPFNNESYKIIEKLWRENLSDPDGWIPEIVEDYDGDGEKRIYVDFEWLADYFIDQLANKAINADQNSAEQN